MSGGLPHTAKSSDQMPEEAPAEQVPDDSSGAPEGAARESARRHARGEKRRASRQHHDSDRRAGEDRAQRQATSERSLGKRP